MKKLKITNKRSEIIMAIYMKRNTKNELQYPFWSFAYNIDDHGSISVFSLCKQ